MSQPDPIPIPKDPVVYIKELLIKKAALDFQIDTMVKELTPKQRAELYQYDHYFPKERIYKI